MPTTITKDGYTIMPVAGYTLISGISTFEYLLGIAAGYIKIHDCITDYSAILADYGSPGFVFKFMDRGEHYVGKEELAEALTVINEHPLYGYMFSEFKVLSRAHSFQLDLLRYGPDYDICTVPISSYKEALFLGIIPSKLSTISRIYLSSPLYVLTPPVVIDRESKNLKRHVTTGLSNFRVHSLAMDEVPCGETDMYDGGRMPQDRRLQAGAENMDSITVRRKSFRDFTPRVTINYSHLSRTEIVGRGRWQ